MMKEHKSAAFLAAMVLFGMPLSAQQSKSAFARAVELLTGEWVAEGAGAPGQGTGAFSFRPELNGKALIRRNRADYPSRAGKPAYHHEDLMMIYQESDTERLRALYLDSEEHAIQYTAEVSEDGAAITFTSTPSQGGPAYRLSYRKSTGGTLAGRFETAPPGKPDAFATYLQWTARRK